ncbi:MAG: hypothetical protein H7Z71_05420 [Moraxellaceae bacterium]|nr:hypothetical protein [Pseudobdellovibrionaceae bacterium]
MNIFLMVLTCLNIILVLGLAFTVFLRVKEKKEDQRITKGLQLLQHKIAILQDLSDRADEQVQRLVHMLDSKSNDLRRVTNEATIAMTSIQSTVQAHQLSAAAAPIVSTNANINVDEFNQFVQALNQQNEKAKPILAAQNNLPQDFVPEAVSVIRPFEFKRINIF